jgi:ABC-type multidrug transport system ATPase subunit
MICEIEALVVRRGGRTIVDRFSLAVDAGETIGIVGKNGCGKSTLVMAIAGVLAPTEGRVAISGANVWGGSRERMRARKALGYVPEAADPPGFLLGGELWAMCAAARASAAARVSVPRCSVRRSCSCSTSPTTGSIPNAPMLSQS